MNIKEPQQLLIDLYRRISSQMKAAFFAAFAAGLAGHLYSFTNKLFNYDELNNTPEGIGEGISLGRWGLSFLGTVLHGLFGNYSLPLVNGLITVFFIALSAAITVKILDMRSDLFSGLTGALMAVFPAVTCTFFFMYTASYYSVALFLAVMSFYILNAGKGRRTLRFVISALLLCFATGIYQAYFPAAVCLCLITLILKSVDSLKDDNEPVRALATEGALYLGWLVSALAVYLIISKLVLLVSHTALPDYQGLDTVGAVNISFIIRSALQSYIHTIHLFIGDVFRLNPTILLKVAFFILFAVTAASLICMIRMCVRAKRYMTLLCVLLAAALMPVAGFLITLMITPDTWVYAIMLYAVVFILILPAVLTDRLCFVGADAEADINAGVASDGVAEVDSDQGDAANDSDVIMPIMPEKIAEWMTFISLTVTILVYIWYANINYQAMQYANFHDMAYYTVLMSQIKSTEGFDDSMPVVILGNIEGDETAGAGQLIDTSLDLFGKSDSNIGSYSSRNILTKYVGFTPVASDEEESFKEDPEVEAMPCYPEDGSIKIIRDTLIVKLSESE